MNCLIHSDDSVPTEACVAQNLVDHRNCTFIEVDPHAPRFTAQQRILKPKNRRKIKVVSHCDVRRVYSQ